MLQNTTDDNAVILNKLWIKPPLGTSQRNPKENNENAVNANVREVKPEMKIALFIFLFLFFC